MNAKWLKLRGEIEHDLGFWLNELDMKHWQVNVTYRVRDPEGKGYCDIDVSDAQHLKADIRFFLTEFEAQGKDRQHREYLVLHEILHLILPSASEPQVARIARTLIRFERARS